MPEVITKMYLMQLDEFIQKDNKGIICEIPDQEIEN